MSFFLPRTKCKPKKKMKINRKSLEIMKKNERMWKTKNLETGKDDFHDIKILLKIIKISECVKERSHMFE